MIGSAALQRALERLERLSLAVERLGGTTAPAALTAEPLAELAAPPLDQGVLAAVLDRLLAGGDPVRLSRPRPLRRRARARHLTAPRPVPFGGEPGPELEPSVTRRTRAGTGSRLETHGRNAEPAIVRAAARAAEPSPAAAARPAFLEEGGVLARLAARVPGGLEAIATPVASSWAPDERGAAATAATVLDDALAQARVRADSEPDTPHEPRERESGRPQTDLPSWLDPDPGEASVGPRTRAAPGLERAESSHGDRADPAPQRLPSWTVERGVEERAEPGGRGLAELVRRWEGGHEAGESGEARRGRLPHERDADDTLAGQGADEALARALERLLAGELRRSGIEMEAG